MSYLYNTPRITIYEPDGGKVQLTVDVVSVSRDVEVGWVPRQFAGRKWAEQRRDGQAGRQGWVGEDGMLHTLDELTPELSTQLQEKYGLVVT